MKFKVGDRIITTDAYWVSSGAERGTVMKVDPDGKYYMIRWDSYSEYKDGEKQDDIRAIEKLYELDKQYHRKDIIEKLLG